MKKFMKLFAILLATSVTLIGCSSNDDKNEGNDTVENGSGEDNSNEELSAEEVLDLFTENFKNEEHILSIETETEVVKFYIQTDGKFALDMAMGDTEMFINCGVDDIYSMTVAGVTYDDESTVSGACDDDTISNMYDEMDLDTIFDLITISGLEDKGDTFELDEDDVTVVVYKDAKKLVMNTEAGFMTFEITDIVLPE